MIEMHFEGIVDAVYIQMRRANLPAASIRLILNIERLEDRYQSALEWERLLNDLTDDA